MSDLYYKKYLKYKKKYLDLKNKQNQNGGIVNNLSFLDDFFINFLSKDKNNNKNLYEFNGRIKKKFLSDLGENNLNQIINEMDFLKCDKDMLPIIKSSNELLYENYKCLNTEIGKSGAIILEKDNNVVKGYIFEKDTLINIDEESQFLIKYKFIKEAWGFDYLMRKVYETNISHNFCALVDIFICDNIISLEENNPYNNLCGDLHNQTNLTNIETGQIDKLMGYIVMEKLDGNIEKDIISKNQLNYGLLFEYLYGKLAIKTIGNIILTDQESMFNTGYKLVDFIRKYTIIQDSERLELWIQDERMIKMYDFEEFRYSEPSEDLIYGQILDIDYLDYSGRKDLDGIIDEHDEKISCRDLALNFLINYREKKQISRFINTIRSTVPPKYLTAPSSDKPIKEFELHINTEIYTSILTESSPSKNTFSRFQLIDDLSSDDD